MALSRTRKLKDMLLDSFDPAKVFEVSGLGAKTRNS